MTTKRRGFRKMVGVCALAGMSSGFLYIPACSLADIGYNIVSGGLSFVEGYTEDILTSLFPPAGEIVDQG